MRWFPAMLMLFLLTGCIQEAKWTWTGDTPGDAAVDGVTGDGTGEVSPSDVPGGEDADVPVPKDTLDTVEPKDACVPDCTGKECGDDGCGGICGICGDDDPCNGNDLCEEGKCVQDSPPDCDDDNPCTTDSCVEGEGCLNDPVTDTAELGCEDGNPCTDNVCVSGECKNPLKDLEELVVEDCLCESDEDCEPLEDGNYCNGTLVCDLEADTPTCMVDEESIVTCALPEGVAPECNVPVCVPETGDCGVGYANEDGPCEDGNACTSGELCKDGECKNGDTVTCGDDNPCTDDSCDPTTGCVNTANTDSCDDDDDCTHTDICSDGTCAGTGYECNQPEQCETADGATCNGDGTCTYETASMDGTPCDDGDLCSDNDQCQGGQCLPGMSLMCEPNPCADVVCDPAQGCVYTNIEGACDDDDPCTTEDHCDGGVCVSSGVLDCHDGNECTDDECVPGVGCDHVPGNEGGTCDGGAGTCVDGVCGLCVPDCTGVACGDDGCGGSCGVCSTTESCLVGFCFCDYWECDGTCCIDPTEVCDDDDVCCLPQCEEKECGGDACDGNCGTCPEQYVCGEDGICQCVPDCVGKACGNNGCGGVCGDCDVDEVCFSDVCVPSQCGDGICDVSDTCENCPGDCGTCPSGCEPPCDWLNEECEEVVSGSWVCTSRMMAVPPGDFWMGCNNCPGSAVNDTMCECDEHSYHNVLLDSYEIDRTEVTAGQYSSCVSAGECEPVDDNDCISFDTTYGKPGKERYPMTCVDWVQAEAYCQWAGKELCTEAQWEKGARGGCEKNGGQSNCMNQSRKYPWGNIDPSGLDLVAHGQVQKVCSKSPQGDSPYGSCDLAGNVWEWTKDNYGKSYYCGNETVDELGCCSECGEWPGSPAAWSNPEGPPSSVNRVTKGGAFYNSNNHLRVSKRTPLFAFSGYGYLGFRCCGSSCVPDCLGKECGDDGCGGNCGVCPATTCSSGECVEGVCQVDVFYCVVEEACVPSGTENPQDSCQKCQPAITQLGWSPLEDGYACGAEKRCWEGSCCDYGAFCADKECGDDGCGGVCGECDGGDVCVDQICCTPDCSDNQCGDDGCGSACGECEDGQSCVELACIDPDVVWSKGFGGDGHDTGYAIDVGPAGEIYLAGRYGPAGIYFGDTFLPIVEGQYDVFMAKLDPNGDHLWSFGHNDSGNLKMSVVASGGHVFLASNAGTSPATVNGVTFSGPSGANGFILEMDSDGEVVWSKEVGAHISGLKIDPQGNQTLVGIFSTSVDLGGGPLSGNFGDAYVARYDPAKQYLWSTGFGGTDAEPVFTVHLDLAGNTFVGGYFKSDEISFGSSTIQVAGGFYDGYLFKVDAQGQPQWALSVGGADGYEIVYSVATDSDGNAYFTGTFTSTTITAGGESYGNQSPGTSNLFLGKVSPTGTLEWFETFGSQGGASGYTVSVSGSQLFLGGQVGAGVDFGTGPQQSWGGFVAAFDLDGTVTDVDRWFGNYNVKAMAHTSGHLYLTGEYSGFSGNVNLGAGFIDWAGTYDAFVVKREL